MHDRRDHVRTDEPAPRTDEDARPDPSGLEAALGHVFRDRDLLTRALTHRSMAVDRAAESREISYERLEFLGDSLIGFVVSAWLVRDDPEAPEGVLSRRKQAVVRAASLAQAAREIGVGRYVRMAPGEESSGGRERTGMLSDVLESLVGAVYVDAGFRAARRVVLLHLRPTLRRARGSDEVRDDYKTRLQEQVQAARRQTPRYRVVRASGPDHDRCFEAEVWVGRKRWASGTGSSRKRAEQDAARRALERGDREA